MRQSLVLIIVALSHNVGVAAEDAEQFFDALFGNRFNRAKATVDRADDLALAKEILAAAQEIERTDVLVVMCNNVIDLAQRHPDGISIAISAAHLLADKLPPDRVNGKKQVQKQLIELLTRQSFSSDDKVKHKAGDELIALFTLQGDEASKSKEYDEAIVAYRHALTVAMRHRSSITEAIKSKIEAARHRSQTQKQAARFREKLQQNSGDVVSANAIIQLCVVDLDNPSEAIQYIRYTTDAKLRKLVSLAAKSLDELSASDSLTLGEWYLGLVMGAAAPAKEAPLRRAAMYLRRYLDFNPTDEIIRIKVSVRLKDVDATIAAIDAERINTQLRRNGPETWISKDSTYKVNRDNGHHRPLPDLLTGGSNLPDGFAFHTAENTAGMYIVIDLGSPRIISRLWIENRRDQAQARAQGMTVSLSLDAKDAGKVIWTAEKVEKEWAVQLPHYIRAQYVTIKQAEKSTQALHLAQVKVFGWNE